MQQEKTIGQEEVERIWDVLGYSIPVEHYDRTPMQKKLVETWTEGKTWEAGCCRVCGDFVPPTPDVSIAGLNPVAGVCEACCPIVDEHYEIIEGAGSKVSNDTPKWNENCPLLFQEIVNYPDVSKDGINWAMYKQVETWQYGRRGMYINGDSGSGKTAAVWAMAKKLEQGSGKAPHFVKAVQLAKLLARSARDLEDDQVTWMGRYGVLIIDDLGKEKITATFASQLFEVINARYEAFKPTIITTKFEGKGLMSRFTDKGEDSTGNDILRRLGQTCEGIKF